MTCRAHPSVKAPTDVITYRYDGDLVYVSVTPSYIQAISLAREAFPQLNHLRDATLSLSLTVPGSERKFVAISASAWPKMITRISQYQVIDVQVAQSREDVASIPIPSITITYADAEDRDAKVESTIQDSVPPYSACSKSDVVDVMDDEKASYPRPSSPTLCPGKRNWFFQKLQG